MKKLNNKIIAEITHKTLNEFLLKESVFPTVTNIKTAINRIYDVVNKYGLNSKLYHDDYWQAIDDYRNAIESLGYDIEIWCEHGGYGDYHETTHMPTSKTYKVLIDCGLPRKIEGYIKMCAAGSMEDHFSAYDTLMVLYPETTTKVIRESIFDFFKKDKNKKKVINNEMTDKLWHLVRGKDVEKATKIIENQFNTTVSNDVDKGNVDNWTEMHCRIFKVNEGSSEIYLYYEKPPYPQDHYEIQEVIHVDYIDWV